MNISNRFFCGIIALGCIALLGFGYYLEYVQDLLPCPMCIFQRLCYFAIAIVGLLGLLHGPRAWGKVVYTALIALFAGVGVSIAARQTWLQHLPPELVPECGPGLEFMLEMYPLLETIERALRGTGDCAEVNWTLLGLSIAEWSVVGFTGIIVLSVWQFVRDRRPGV